MFNEPHTQSEIKKIAYIRQMLDAALEKKDNAQANLFLAFPNAMAVHSNPDDNNR